jgi:benzil reductase ((S)-benzoin forming)
MHLYIVTGASRGLGWHLAQLIARKPDASLLAVSRSGLPQPLERADDVRCDLASPEGQRVAAAAIGKKLGEAAWGKAVLVNNAGIAEPARAIEGYDQRELAYNISLNLIAPIALMQAFVAASAKVPERTIINISSGAARQPRFGWTAYCSSKAGLDMASRVVALEAKTKGMPLRVTSLAPGVMDTAMQDEVRAKSPEEFPDVERFRRLKARGQLGRPEDVAAAILGLEQSGALPEGLADLRDL